jgi:hypothetical protein
MNFHYIVDSQFIQFSDNKYITEVTFAMDRYSLYYATLKFPNPKTEHQTIHHVERFLNKPISENYFHNINKNNQYSFNFEHLKENHYSVRGDLLGSCIYLEELTIVEDTKVILICGS